MNNHQQPLGIPVPDLSQIARPQQVAIPMTFAGHAAFTINLPYNATATQRSQAARTARLVMLEFATGQAPQEPDGE